MLYISLLTVGLITPGTKCLWFHGYTYRIYSYKSPGADAFFKRGQGGGGGGATTTGKKNQLSSPVAMGDSEH